MITKLFILSLFCIQVLSLPVNSVTDAYDVDKNVFRNLSTSTKIAHDSLFDFKGDTGSQDEDTIFVSSDFLPNPSRLISAVQDKNDRLKVSSWLVEEDGSISKRGDNGSNKDDIKQVDVVSHNGRILTPIRTQDHNKGFLISWKLSPSDNTDSITEVDRASIFDGEVSIIRIEAVFDDIYVTSFREHTKKILHLVSWRINPDGTISKLATVNSGVVADSISVLHLEHPFTAYVLTTIADSQGKMELFMWHVNHITGAIVLAGASSTSGAPVAKEIRPVTIGGRIYTSYQTSDNELRVIGWTIDQGTLNIAPVKEVGERKGTMEQHGLVAFTDLHGRHRLVSGLRTGSDKVVLVDWIVAKDKEITKNNELTLSQYSPHPKFGKYDLHIISHPFAQLILAFRTSSDTLKMAS